MIKSIKVKTGELEFDCRVSGEESGEPLILLHGFPETSIMWSGLMGRLSSKGFYCIAPDMRGYSENACPRGVGNYTIKELSNDIIRIANQLNLDRFHLIGHDWGAGIGWNITYKHPKRVICWTALSIPHSRAFRKALKTDKEQKRKSRYIGLFLLPFIPEITIKWNDFEKFRKLWRNSAPEEVGHYLSVFRRKYTLTAALNYYRANLRKSDHQPVGDIEVPTLFIWGKNDLAVGDVAVQYNSKYIKGDYTFLALEGGHWLMQTNYTEVASAIDRHLSNNRTVSNTR